MRKNFLLLFLMALMPLAGWAQFSVGNYLKKDNYIYEITQQAVGSTPGRVELLGILDGMNPVDANKALVLEGKVTMQIVGGDSFDFIVDFARPDALKKTYTYVNYATAPTEVGAFAGMTTAESVVIPKEFLTIKATTFVGYTNMKSISFEANSEVTTIENGSFSTTQISTFDFSNCAKLTTIGNGVFVEASPAINSYVKTITLPANSEALTNIGTAFQRLPNLTAINNLDQSKITTVAANAFDGDAKLETLALPGTVQTIAANAFVNSGIKNLTIDVTSLNDATVGNVYGASVAKLQSLTLKGVLSGTLKPQAFQGCTNLATLNTTDFTIAGAGKIGANAFENCTSLTSLVISSIKGTDNTTRAIIDAQAFKGCTKLSTITINELEFATIGTEAFANCGTHTSVTAAALTLGDMKDVIISGTATTNGAFYNNTKLSQISFGESEGLNIQTFAFENATSAIAAPTATLVFGDAKTLTIAADAFNGASKLLSATFGDLEGSTIGGDAFVGAAKLETVTIEDITNGVIGDGAKAVFPALKAVTIGSIKSEANATIIAAKAFTYKDVSGATFTQTEGASLETVAAATNAMIAAGAFDFSAVATVGAGHVDPVAVIGEIKTAMTMGVGALKGNRIAKITFDGNIAAGALDAMIVKDGAGVSTALLQLTTLIFNGEIGAAGIGTYAFQDLPAVATITFNGKMAAGAVAAGAFENLLADSQIEYTYNGADIDLTANPFAKQAFKVGSATGNPRIIKFAVTNTDLKAKYQDAGAGLGTDGTFDVYLAYFYVPVVTDLSFKVYPDLANDASTAWARWELGYRVDPDVTGTLASGTNLVIKRVQQIDGTHNAKITVYGTYTDEDEALNASTVYMVPLKAENGYYHIPGTNKTTLIVKVENKGADFTETSYKVKVNQTGYDAYDANVTATGAGSIWPGLVNKELYVANNIMTNQQLIDKQATDAASADASGVYGYFHAARTVNDVDIYRGGTTDIVENLYIMNNPAKNKGFRIDKNEISSTNNAYINVGWYYMLLKKYTGEPAAARVVWMGEDENVTAILGVKKNVKKFEADAIYNLQGVRVDNTVKGQVYIMNGKKFIAQ